MHIRNNKTQVDTETDLWFPLLLAALTLFIAVLTTLLVVRSASQSPSDPPVTVTTGAEQEDDDPPEQFYDPSKKHVAITFDDGPSRQGLTKKLVDEFDKYNGHATLFVLGNLVSEGIGSDINDSNAGSTGAALTYASSHGWEVGIHAYSHTNYFDICPEEVYADELEKTKNLIELFVPGKVTLMRPPGGGITSARVAESPYFIINWSVDSLDYENRLSSYESESQRQEYIRKTVDKVLNEVKDGDIVLMHEIYLNSYEAACAILKELNARGFQFVTVTELIGSDNLETGTIYYSQTKKK